MSCFAHLTSEMFLNLHPHFYWLRKCLNLEVKLPNTFFWILFKSIRGFWLNVFGQAFLLKNISSFISARLEHINENPWRAELIWEQVLNGNTTRTFEMTRMLLFCISFFFFQITARRKYNMSSDIFSAKSITTKLYTEGKDKINCERHAYSNPWICVVAFHWAHCITKKAAHRM